MDLVRRRLLSLAGAGLTSGLAVWVLAKGPANTQTNFSNGPYHPRGEYQEPRSRQRRVL